jgi:hypothetical protein
MKTAENRPVKVEFRRLQFLLDFMNVAGLNPVDVARILKTSVPTVRHWLKENVDDTKLSYVYRIAAYTGFKFDLLLTRSGKEGTGAIPVNIDDYIQLPGEQYRPKTMSFLTLALRRYGLTKKDVAEATGLSYSSIAYFFSSDDISISRILDIANSMDFCIRYSFTRIDEPIPDPDLKHNCTVSIVKKSVVYF